MALFAAPLLVLMFVAFLICWNTDRRRAKRAAKDELRRPRRRRDLAADLSRDTSDDSRATFCRVARREPSRRPPGQPHVGQGPRRAGRRGRVRPPARLGCGGRRADRCRRRRGDRARSRGGRAGVRRAGGGRRRRDGPPGPAGRRRHRRTRSASSPRAPATTSPASSASRAHDPLRGRRRDRRRGRRAVRRRPAGPRAGGSPACCRVRLRLDGQRAGEPHALAARADAATTSRSWPSCGCSTRCRSRITLDGEPIEREAMLVAVGNGDVLRRRHEGLPRRARRRRAARRHGARQDRQAGVPARLPDGLQGHPRRAPGGDGARARGRCCWRRPAWSPTPTASTWPALCPCEVDLRTRRLNVLAPRDRDVALRACPLPPSGTPPPARGRPAPRPSSRRSAPATTSGSTPSRSAPARRSRRARACSSRRPTGSGKTVVGEFAVHLALAEGRKCFYTTPIKALSNQKYADLVAPLRRRRGRPADRRQHASTARRRSSS